MFTKVKFPFQINVFFEPYIHQRKLNTNVSQTILSSTTVLNIDNNKKCFLSSRSAYYVFSEESCDTEDWSNDAENSAWNHRNKLHFKIFSNSKKFF